MKENKIYKYMPYRKEFFENFLLRITQKNALNDPFEMEPSINWWVDLFLESRHPSKRFGNTKEEIKEFIASQPKNSNWRHFGIDFFKTKGIISFSATKDNILMWSHYANNHQGIVVEFDSLNDFFHKNFLSSTDSNEGKLKKVTYEKTRLTNLKDDLNSPYFHKAKNWKYEREYRLLLNFGVSDMCLFEKEKVINISQDILNELSCENYNATLKRVTSRVHYGLAEDSNMMFMIKIPESAIKAIYLGANCLDVNNDIINNKKELLNMFLKIPKSIKLIFLTKC
jgi:hypothetical protein